MAEKEKMGRRERKKLMLRDALITASYELFALKGFDETRIEDITDKVDVSNRTFFRYFSSKEDVVLDYQQAEHESFIAALNRRPFQEPVITALRHAAVEVVRKYESGSADRFMMRQELLRSHPLVRAKALQQSEERSASIVSLIAQRMEANVTLDLRPSIVVGMIDYAHCAAYDAWKKKKSASVLYSDVLNEVFLIIESGLNFSAKYKPDDHSDDVC
ncbi:TetR family transcriptional regulator [Vibrio spartinae]|uniref:Bacterial regulatory proteins, tetR family n=1 Tax=Vibrio spartinae TaxID=1918945 RepID=A0A1N6M698_9VIBR|nr:TetR family transcriptional regulator [Vibrio spartinae]QMV14758.1 HTH-type transcriptional regulator RutR [Vibrio spartinae]SIO94962.1 Bacterial regulatory proteins, tetR family [Vibrio spartinae]